jgi:hypothetical protein
VADEHPRIAKITSRFTVFGQRSTALKADLYLGILLRNRNQALAVGQFAVLNASVRAAWPHPGILTLLGALAMHPSIAAADSIDLAGAKAAFAERGAICAADRGRLWGRDLCGPILFADDQSRQVVADRAGNGGVLHPQDGVFVGQFPSELGIANTATDWDGVRWTMVEWPLPQDEAARHALLMHESFHRIQTELGLPPNGAVASDLASTDGRIGLRLEWRALAAALTATAEPARKQAVADALGFRRARRVQAGPAAEQERLLEMNEGLAEYTGQKLSGAPNLSSKVARSLGTAEHWENYARRFAYASGPAYGLLLDHYDAQWRAHLKGSDDLGNLLAGAARLQPTANLRVAERRYQGEVVRTEENALGAERARTAAMWSAKLISAPTLYLPIVDPSKVQVVFDPRTLFPLPPHGTVYPSLRVSEAWGTLQTDDGAMIDDKWTGVVTAAPAKADLRSGNGWMLELRPGWHLSPGTRPGDLIATRDGS